MEYKLSDQGYNILLEDLEKTDKDEDEVTGLENAEVHTKFLNRIFGVENINDVIGRQEDINDEFIWLLNLYGFEDSRDMYLYAESCDLFPPEIFQDNSVLVNKTIIRNNERVSVNVWRGSMNE